MKSLVNILLFLASVLLVCLLLPRLILFFMPLVIGWIIAMIANPLVRFMEKRMKIVRKHSSMLIIIGAVALVVFGGYFAISRIAREIYGFIGTLPELYNFFLQDLAETENNLQGIMSRFPPNLTESLSRLIDSLTNSLGDIIGTIGTPTVAAAGSIARNIPNALINVIFAVLSAYFFIAEREKILQWGREHTPDTVRQKWQFIMGKFRKAVGGYFKAQFKIMAVIGVILFVGMLILKVRFAILVAILVAFLDMLPFLGTGTVLLPWAVFKLLSGDVRYAVGLVILYLVTQLVRRIIEPKLVGDSIGMNPLVTLIFMYIGYRMGGVLGMILAVPVGAIVLNFYKAGTFDRVINGFKEAGRDLFQWMYGDRPS